MSSYGDYIMSAKPLEPTVRTVIEHLSQFPDDLSCRLRNQLDPNKSIELSTHAFSIENLDPSVAHEHGINSDHPICVVIG